MMLFLSNVNDWLIADGVFTPFEIPFRNILNIILNMLVYLRIYSAHVITITRHTAVGVFFSEKSCSMSSARQNFISLYGVHMTTSF